jgi:nucleotide-binding universal stress UspA family protein
MQAILVPYDGSDSAGRAVQYAAGLWRQGRAAQVHVLTVQENPVYFEGIVDGNLMMQILDSLRDSAQRLALRAGELLAKAGAPHQLHVQIGLIGETIVEQARALGCDAIVMGTHGRGALLGLVLGSVATRVVHLSPVPVTLVK